MDTNELEAKLQTITDFLVKQLISLTPKSMTEIRFELLENADGGADIRLVDNHPDVKGVTLNDALYRAASQYVPLVKQYVPGWRRSLLIMRELADGWDVQMTYQHD